FFQAEDGIRDFHVTGVQTCALPICHFFALVALATSGLALLAMTSAYRMKRLTAFLDPWADPFNSGFQLTQSLIAIGRGEMFGVRSEERRVGKERRCRRAGQQAQDMQ